MNDHAEAPAITAIADDILLEFRTVGDAAETALRTAHSPGDGSLASVNTLTSGRAIRALDKVGNETRQNWRTLAGEPAIARVTTRGPRGTRTWYVCRATPIDSTFNLVSYRAPLGRLASLAVGDRFTLPGGESLEITDRARLRPFQADQLWDSEDTLLETESSGVITIGSLRALIESGHLSSDEGDVLGAILAAENQAENVFVGARRSVILKMALRDQPVLDKYQDEIFRLPLSERLMILGPPGTGKTTTLIHRLGQKLQPEFLEESERDSVDAVRDSSGEEHSASWLMFTPTELLKQYLKEAFALEGIPASDSHLSTWADYGRQLARTGANVLRTAAGGGPFVLKESAHALTDDALTRPTEWFSTFDRWQQAAFVEDLKVAADGLRASDLPAAAGLGGRLRRTVERMGSQSLAEGLISLVAEVNEAQGFVAKLKEVTDERVRRALTLQVNRDKGFIDALAKFIDGIQEEADTDSDDPEDVELDDEDPASAKTRPAAALRAYSQSIRAQARAAARASRVRKASRTGRVLEWIGERGLSEQDREEVGGSLLVQAMGRRFTNPVKRYLDGIPSRYRTFRRNSSADGTWYRRDGFASTDLHPQELDAVLLAILRSVYDLLGRSVVSQDIDLPVWASLKAIRAHYRNQVLVDEATDFSPLQLACMAALSQPRIRAFVACGDFNQRLTSWGTRSMDELSWACGDLTVRKVTVCYRQTRQLGELAHAIVAATGAADLAPSLPDGVDSEGVAPVLLEQCSDSGMAMSWLAERIREIERNLGELPSVAVFVVNEAEVQAVANQLNAELARDNIQVLACVNGRVIGQENDVRVFDVQHIKGLEFEAAFFVGVDRLETLYPQLSDKYVYVGATRAATYLGITCDGELPRYLSSLRAMFGAGWAQ